MLVVVCMLIYITALTGGLVWLYYKNIKLSNVWARRIEVFGYILLIVLAIWTFAVKNVAFGQFYNDDWIFLNEKLHYIFSWNYQSA